MSQSITLSGVYKNNKLNTVGMLNPKNNRFFSVEEIMHLEKMINENLVPKYDKFKSIKMIMHNEGKIIHKGEYSIKDFKNNSTNKICTELVELYKFHNK